MLGWLDANLITLVDGVAYGVLLFTIALGLSLVFGVMDVLNLAHGALFLVGAYVAVQLLGAGGTAMGLFLLAAVTALVIGAIGGAGLARLCAPLQQRGHLDQALLTLGVALIVGDLLSARFGTDVKAVDAPAALAGSADLAGNAYPVYRLVVIAVGLALAAGAYLLVERTRYGALVRASVVDPQMLRSLGVDTGRLTTVVFAGGAALASFGGVLGAPILSAFPGLDSRVLILGLVVIVVGGLGSVSGALVGALLIGQVQVLGVALLPTYASFLLFAAMAAVLLLRPAGLLGARAA